MQRSSSLAAGSVDADRGGASLQHAVSSCGADAVMTSTSSAYLSQLAGNWQGLQESPSLPPFLTDLVLSV
jgi:hypothetical protein